MHGPVERGARSAAAARSRCRSCARRRAAPGPARARRVGLAAELERLERDVQVEPASLARAEPEPAEREDVGSLGHTIVIASGPQSLFELALEHLAGRVARQLVDEHDVARDLVAGEVRLDVLLDLVGRHLLLGHDDGLQPLAELLVVDAEDRDLLDRVVALEQLLDLRREDVLAAGDDHVVVAAVDEQPPVVVEVADVAGATSGRR